MLTAAQITLDSLEALAYTENSYTSAFVGLAF